MNNIIDLFRKKPPSATDKLFFMFANCEKIEAFYERLEEGSYKIKSEFGTISYRRYGSIYYKDNIGYYIDSDNVLHSLKERPSKRAEKAFMQAFEENLYGGILK